MADKAKPPDQEAGGKKDKGDLPEPPVAAQADAPAIPVVGVEQWTPPKLPKDAPPGAVERMGGTGIWIDRDGMEVPPPNLRAKAEPAKTS